MDSFNTTYLDILSSNSSSYMFISDTVKGDCYWSQNCFPAFGAPKKKISVEEFAVSMMHKDDALQFTKDYRSVLEGEVDCIAKTYRVKNAANLYMGLDIRMWVVGDGDLGTPNFLIGIMVESDREQYIDPVTELPDNYSFRKCLARKTVQKGRFSVIMLGIDDFKNINELYTYSVGDLLLQDCVSRFRQLMPENAILFRLDGDGFGIILPDSDEEDVRDWYSSLKKDYISNRFDVGTGKLLLTISGGACCYPKDGTDFETIYHNASKALQTAKRRGKNRLVIYSEELVARDRRNAALLSALRESVVLGFKGFHMVYQPIVSAADQSLVGSEALLRWKHTNFPNEVSPSEFVPILEDNGLMLETGRWVLETAIRQCSEWCKYKSDFQMNINVSSLQFELPSFKYLLMELLSEYHVKPSNITLELTESGKVKDPINLSREFDFIRGQGVHIALDDFGTGYSSLEVFRLLSADELKIDRSFLERISYDVTDQALLSTLINLSRSMNMEVCVEGIENGQTESQICRMGPDLLQGYLYDRPLSAKDFEEKYFSVYSSSSPSEYKREGPERTRSLVYAQFRPAQSIDVQEMVDNAYAGIFQVGMDEEFSFLTCNEGYRRMLGYTAAEVEKKFKNHALGFVHPDDIEKVNNEIRRQLGEGDTVTIEFRVVRKDGTPIWIVGTGNVYRSNDGTTSLVVVIINNDKNKRAQLARESEYAITKKLMDNLPTGIKCVRFDAEFTIDFISQSLLNLMGYTKEDISQRFGGKYINLIYEEDRALIINDILEQLKVSNIVTMKYRSPCKDGRLIHLETISKLCEADEDGIQRAVSVVVDITDNEEEEIEKGRGLNIANRYELMAAQWGEYFFEYDFGSDKVAFSDNFNRIFGYGGPIEFEEVLEIMYRDERQIFTGAIEKAKQGIRPEPMELRLHLPEGAYRWFSVVMTIPEKFGDKSMTVLGKIIDIDDERREKEQLLLKSQRDSMTHLLNKATTEEAIRNELVRAKDTDHFAFFVIDIDHFKEINDTYGHFAGDEVLQAFSCRIKNQFRKDDIIGRVGGDEFMVFMPYNGNTDQIIAKAENLVQAIRQPLEIEGNVLTPTVSIGISCYPEDGDEFYDLFRRADSALYRRKSMNRDGYCLAAKFIQL